MRGVENVGNVINFSSRNILHPFKNIADIQHALTTCYTINIDTHIDELQKALASCTSNRDKIAVVCCAALRVSNPLTDAQKWFYLSDISDNISHSLDIFLAIDSLFFLRSCRTTDNHKSLRKYYSAFSGETDKDENDVCDNYAKNVRNFNKHANNRLRDTPLKYLWDFPTMSHQGFSQKTNSNSSYKIPKFMDDFLYSLLKCPSPAHPFASQNNAKLTFNKLKSFFEYFYSEINPNLPDGSSASSKQVILSNYLARQLFDINTAAYISQLSETFRTSIKLTQDTTLDYLIPIFFIPNPFARNRYCNLIFRLLLSGDALITCLDSRKATENNIIASVKTTQSPAATQEHNLKKLSQFLQHQIFSVYPLVRSVFYYFLCEAFPKEHQRESALLSFIQADTSLGGIFTPPYDYGLKKSETFPEIQDHPNPSSWVAFWETLEPNSDLLVSIFKKLNAKLSDSEFIEKLYQSSQLNFIESTALYREKILDAVVTVKSKTDVGLFPH